MKKRTCMKRLINKLKHFFRKNKSDKDPSFMDINPDKASLKKVIYFRIISIVISMVTAYYYLSEIYSSIEMVIVETVILTIVHFVFEELWEKRPKGKYVWKEKE